MRIVQNSLLGAFAALGMVLPAVAAERAIIVLDGSGSMWAQIEDKARITIARETLSEVLSTLPDDLELGFLTYGHREKGNCGDIEMLVEPAAGTGRAILAAAQGINPKGMTPISDAVRLAAEQLQFVEQKATVILITDGLETCEVDPCALAADLENRGIDFTTHVLGFGLSDEEGQQVACLAENTGGRYLPANDGDALVEALTATVAEVTRAEAEAEPLMPLAINLRPTVALSEGGPRLADETHGIAWTWYAPAADGTKGAYVGTGYYSNFEGDLPDGNYILEVEVGHAAASQPISVDHGSLATPHFVVEGAVLRLHPRPSDGAAVDENALIEIRHAGEYVTSEYGDTELVVPAGDLEVDVTIGEATVTRSYQVAAGEAIDEDVVVGVGRADVTAFYVEGMPASDDIFIEILAAAKALDGSRQSISYAYGSAAGFDLPEGEYVATYRLRGVEGEVPFSIRTAEVSEVEVVLDAGVLAVTTPGADYVELFGAASGIDGKRASFDYGYGPAFQTVLPGGDYVVFASIGGGTSETTVTVKGGERIELTIAAPPAGKTK